jgi:mRNA interferase RelE/StbE
LTSFSVRLPDDLARGLEDLAHTIDRPKTHRILRDLEEMLKADPESGTPLSGQFKGMFKLRIGDYRVVYPKTRNGVLVLRIGHRSTIYYR